MIDLSWCAEFPPAFYKVNRTILLSSVTLQARNAPRRTYNSPKIARPYATIRKPSLAWIASGSI
jgi:hypothetical protein